MSYDYRGARQSVFASALPWELRLLALAFIEFMPECKPSVARLAQMCGCDRRTVLRHISKLERTGFLTVGRSNGSRSSYSLSPVTISVTGVQESPVTLAPVTGDFEDLSPVTKPSPTGDTALSPKAVEADQKADLKREERAPEGVSRVYSLPAEEPTKAYLDEALMRAVTVEQARSTWSHYWGAGLPPGGVEKLYPWLCQRAKERSNQTAHRPRNGHSGASGTFQRSIVDAEPVWTTHHILQSHRSLCQDHGLGDVEKVARAWLKSALTPPTLLEGEQGFTQHLRSLVRKQRAGARP